jgi:hypothetical protein
VAGDEDSHQGRQLRGRAEQRRRARRDHELLGADEAHAGRGRCGRQLRYAAERGEGGDPEGASGGNAHCRGAGTGSAARGLRRVGDNLSRPRLVYRFCRRERPRSHPIAHLLCVPSPRHQHPVPDPGADRAGGAGRPGDRR